MHVYPLVALCAVVAISQGIAGCKSDKEDEPLPLPVVPVASIAAATGSTPAAVVPVVPVVPVTPVVKAPTPVVPGAKVDAGTPVVDAGAPASDAGTASDAGAGGDLSGKLAACAAKCQGIMQTCLTPTFSADGGFPQMKDPAACQAAFEACRTGCAL